MDPMRFPSMKASSNRCSSKASGSPELDGPVLDLTRIKEGHAIAPVRSEQRAEKGSSSILESGENLGRVAANALADKSARVSRQSRERRPGSGLTEEEDPRAPPRPCAAENR